jgi:hypothetical protein
MLNNVQSVPSGKSASGGLNLSRSAICGNTLVILMLLFLTTIVNCQSVFTYSSGSSIGVLSGADLCANIIGGSGIIYGGGTICGGLVSIEPIVSNELPATFDMLQNYPNPFNPVTVIKYQLPKANYVTIKLYDQLGREAAVLYEGNQQAGYYQASVDGTNLASGIYFCRITSGEGFSKVIKMSLIK